MLVASEHGEEMTAAGANGVNVAGKNSTWEESGSSPFNAAATVQWKKSFGDFPSEQGIAREDGRHEEERPISMQAQSSSLKTGRARSQPAKLDNSPLCPRLREFFPELLGEEKERALKKKKKNLITLNIQSKSFRGNDILCL